MRLTKLSKFLIFITIWAYVTTFIAIKAYDAGYIAGVEKTTKAFLYFARE